MDLNQVLTALQYDTSPNFSSGEALEADRDKFKGEVEHLAKLPAEEFAAWQARFHAVKTRLEAKL